MTDALSATVELAKDLIARRSVTPEDAGCQEVMIQRLEAIGFRVERMRFGDVDNFWARRGDSEPVYAFAGHTDVVPTGPELNWQHPPFVPTIENGMLYGRGAADMKGSLAAMVTACERFVAEHPDHRGSIGLLITSDEEGVAINGTVKVIEQLESRNEKITGCLVGEPTSTSAVGDVIKNGRRGSLNGVLTVHGVQGHVAYPHHAENPIHKVAPVLAELTSITWDNGNEFFPPTSFQISNINAGTGATNVIPGDVKIVFNFRYCTETTQEKLQERVEAILNAHDLNFEIEWGFSGLPFLTSSGDLVEAAREAVSAVQGFVSELSTTGGTSDGRFIAPTGAQVVELGPLNATIHKVNECVSIEDLDKLSSMYQHVLESLLLD